jgi:hypothetical protein
MRNYYYLRGRNGRLFSVPTMADAIRQLDRWPTFFVCIVTQTFKVHRE